MGADGPNEGRRLSFDGTGTRRPGGMGQGRAPECSLGQGPQERYQGRDLRTGHAGLAVRTIPAHGRLGAKEPRTREEWELAWRTIGPVFGDVLVAKINFPACDAFYTELGKPFRCMESTAFSRFSARSWKSRSPSSLSARTQHTGSPTLHRRAAVRSGMRPRCRASRQSMGHGLSWPLYRYCGLPTTLQWRRSMCAF